MTGSLINHHARAKSSPLKKIHHAIHWFVECQWKGWVVGAVAVLMLFGYLFEVNALAIKGFEIQEVEKQIVALEKEHNDLKVTVAQMQSLNDLEGISRNLNLVKINQAEYLPSMQGVVAWNK